MSQKSPQVSVQLTNITRVINELLASAPSAQWVKERRSAGVGGMYGAKMTSPRYQSSELIVKEADKDIHLRACLAKAERTSARFAAAVEQNEADIKRLTSQIADVAKEAEKRVQDRDRLREQCAQLEAALQTELKAANERLAAQEVVVRTYTEKREMQAALEAAKLLSKYTDEAAAALSKVTSSPERSLINAIAPGLEKADASCRDSSARKDVLQRELEEAMWRRVQIKTTRAVLQLLDDYVGEVAALGEVAQAPSLEVQGLPVDSDLLFEGEGMSALLASLEAPRYELMGVDLASLRTGNEPVPVVANLYCDEYAPARTGHSVEFVDPPPARPGDRPVTITVSDPEQDPQRYVKRING